MARSPNIKSLMSTATDGKDVSVCGWVKSKRVSKNFAFVVINDGSQQHDLQVVVDAAIPAFSKLDDVHTGGSVSFQGTLKASPGKGQQWEVLATDMSVLGTADPEKYPLQKKGHTLEFLREISHLRPRTNTYGAVFRVRNVL